MTKTLSLLLVVCLFAGVAGASHVIDDFSEGNFNGGLSLTSGSQTETEPGLNPAHVIGGERVTTLTVVIAASTRVAEAFIIDQFDEVSYSNESRVASELRFVYGANAPLNVDLSGASSFDFEIHHIDLNVDVHMTVTDADSTDTVVLSIASVGVLSCPFSGFTGIDFSNVKKLEVLLTGPAALDMHLLRIGTDLEPLASIGDFVWHDLNGNGIQDAGEPGIDGVTVNLYDGAGGFVATTTTSGGGAYTFTGLTQGDYFVEFIRPAGFDFTPRDVGVDDTVDSDADEVTGRTVTTTLTPDEHDPTWDAGLVELPPTGDDDDDDGCTYTIGYWKNHPDAWPVQQLTLGDVVYTKAEAIALLNTPPKKGDATIILAHQLIGAKLNVANGADDTAVADTIADADDWLVGHPVGTNPKGPSRAIGIALSETLDAYNNGDIGPGHCDGQGSF